MRVGILGSGLMGGKLGTIFARAGHEVVFSCARSSDKLKRLARDAHGNARAGSPAEAAKDADAILLAVHWSRIDDVLKQAGDLSGKVILTCSLPMDAGNTKLIIGTTTSGAEELAKKVPRAHVVCAFNTVPSEVLFGVFEAKDKSTPPSLVYCGDNQKVKDVAVTLIHDAGFDPVDVGSLRIARYTEPFALLMGEIAYVGKGGPEVAYRFERFRGYQYPTEEINQQRKSKDGHQESWHATFRQRTVRLVHWHRTDRLAISGQCPGACWRCNGHIRARCSHCLAHASAGPDADRHLGLRLGTARGRTG